MILVEAVELRDRDRVRGRDRGRARGRDRVRGRVKAYRARGVYRSWRCHCLGLGRSAWLGLKALALVLALVVELWL